VGCRVRPAPHNKMLLHWSDADSVSVRVGLGPAQGSLYYPEAITHVTYGFDEEVGGILYFAAQSADVNVHGTGAPEVVILPDPAQ